MVWQAVWWPPNHGLNVATIILIISCVVCNLKRVLLEEYCWACRCYYESQLQPVPGRDLFDWIRSLSGQISPLYVTRWGIAWQHALCLCSVSYLKHLKMMIGLAGTTSAVVCSLCNAGAYSTGSGQRLSSLYWMDCHRMHFTQHKHLGRYSTVFKFF
jgi:hypothetical protein